MIEVLAIVSLELVFSFSYWGLFMEIVVDVCVGVLPTAL